MVTRAMPHRRVERPRSAVARPANLYESVYETLRRAIARGIVPAGRQLVVSRLALEMDVSRTPVRDALSRLEALGLVRRHGRSYAVVGLTPGDIDEMAIVRCALEGTAAALAAERIKLREIQRLRTLARELDDAGMRSDVESYRRLHGTFHAQVVACSRNVYLQRSLGALMNFIDLAWEATSPSRERLNRARQQHREIVRALAGRDPEKARRVVGDHVMIGMGLISRALRQQSVKSDLRYVMAEVGAMNGVQQSGSRTPGNVTRQQDRGASW